MRKRLIIFLIRSRFGLKEYQTFRFVGQNSNAVYFFTKNDITKYWRGILEPSSVSLHWFLNDECKIKEVGVELPCQ